ncbi:hypothetical protein QBC37DRAFT_379807 [Rhypophila decipiens]|uniref:Uncharacterized protein n=1 Tax=Rhypophila decipiens TaxID=261697 RepID=A0AAN6XW57_9PEZI|nr:hypothetical protein QBC37DRAFT_379807 [Rhypophila decipiens]
MSIAPPEPSTGVALSTPTPSLLGIPPEIRAIIYQYVFADDKDLIVHLYPYHRWSRIGRSSSGIGAIRSCRTIYLEAIDLLYSTYRFVVDCPREYLRIGHENAMSIRCLEFRMGKGTMHASRLAEWIQLFQNFQIPPNTFGTDATGFSPPRIKITLYYMPYTAPWEYHWTKDLELGHAIIDLQARIKTSTTTVLVAFSRG